MSLFKHQEHRRSRSASAFTSAEPRREEILGIIAAVVPTDWRFTEVAIHPRDSSQPTLLLYCETPPVAVGTWTKLNSE